MSTTAEMNQEALTRATSGQSFANYAAIFEGFGAKGIAEADIEPRVNVLTYNAWKAKGRQVKADEHGVKVVTWIPIREKRDAAGRVTKKAGKRCKRATVFHVSQTEAAEHKRAPELVVRERGKVVKRLAIPTPQVAALDGMAPLGMKARADEQYKGWRR